MGLCTVQPITLSKLSISSYSPFLPKPSLPNTLSPLTPTAALLSRSICLRNLSPKASSSDEESIGGSQFFNEKRDGVITLEDVKEDNKNGFDKTVIGDTKEELPDDGQGLAFDFLEKLNLDTDDTASIVLYGGGALVTLWLTSAVIGAIDSIPLFPKLLEVVGLAYSVWFTSRYLLFKQNREELGAKIEELKGQIFGSEDK